MTIEKPWDGGPMVQRLIAEGARPNPACGVTTTVKTAPFRGDTLFFRCDREQEHEGQHHGTQPDQSEMYWGMSVEQIHRALHGNAEDGHNFCAKCAEVAW